MKTVEEITPPEPRTKIISKAEPDPKKRRIIEQIQPHNSPSHISHFLNRISPSSGELNQIEKDKLHQLHQKSVREIIASAAEAAAAEEAAVIAEAKAKADAAAEKAARKKDKSSKKSLTLEEYEANKEKRLKKLIGAVVVKHMSKHSKSFDHDAFKKHAKEV